MSGGAMARSGRPRGRRRSAALLAIIVAAVVAAMLPGAGPAHAAEPDIVPNGGFEEAAAGDPSSAVGWQPLSWGTTQATPAIVTVGARSGARAARVDVVSTDGAAGFAFAPQPVTAGTAYRYEGWHTATVEGEILAVFTTTDGTVSYLWLGATAVADAWTAVVQVFTVPDDAVALTVFHTISAAGTLQLDDISIRAMTTVPPTFNGLVANGDVEQPNPLDQNRPISWGNDQWGDNDTAFTYATTDAHSGVRALRAETSRYVDGGAKWSFDPVPIEAGTRYLYSGWTRGTSPTEILAVYATNTGAIAFQRLGVTDPSTTWTRYATSFTAPADVTSMTVFQSITSVGWFEADDIGLTPFTPTPFKRALVSLTFDDGYLSHYTVARPKLRQANLRGTFYISTGDLGTRPPPRFMSTFQVTQMSWAGMEIGSHSVTHPMLTTVTPAQQDAELSRSKSTLQWLTWQPVASFASPHGDYNGALLAKIASRFTTHRTIDVGVNDRDTLDFNRIKARMVYPTTTPAEVQAWVNEAKAERTWLVIVFHDIITAPTDYDVTPTNFAAMIDVVKRSGVTVKTVTDARAELLPQLP